VSAPKKNRNASKPAGDKLSRRLVVIMTPDEASACLSAASKAKNWNTWARAALNRAAEP
jgi:hypothetical protein